MQALSPERILAVWELGRDQHELDRALTLLAAGVPEASGDELATLGIGERDARLLQLRALTLGPRARAHVECPACAAKLEFPVDTAALSVPAAARGTVRELEWEGKCVRFRLPTSRDLAAVVAAHDADTGLGQLVRSCVVADCETGQSEMGELTPALLEALGAAMLRADPQAEITLALKCPDCAHEWQTLFDVADFFWHELAAQAKQLLRDVDALARAYGWTEHEILRLPARRRRTYLELVNA